MLKVKNMWNTHGVKSDFSISVDLTKNTNFFFRILIRETRETPKIEWLLDH